MSNNEMKLAEKIHASYQEKTETKLDKLKAMDRRVKRPAQVVAYIFGSIGALVLGGGMCLAMPEVIEGYMPLGIGIGLVGILMVSVNYPVFKAHLASRKRKAAAEILKLSGEILEDK
jgi:hypothetical protein